MGYLAVLPRPLQLDATQRSAARWRVSRKQGWVQGRRRGGPIACRRCSLSDCHATLCTARQALAVACGGGDGNRTPPQARPPLTDVDPQRVALGGILLVGCYDVIQTSRLSSQQAQQQRHYSALLKQLGADSEEP